MVFVHRDEYTSQYEAILSIAAKIGCSRETLRHWVRQAERDQGLRAGPTAKDDSVAKSAEQKLGETAGAIKREPTTVAAIAAAQSPTLQVSARPPWCWRASSVE
jgi:transposase-like protein